MIEEYNIKRNLNKYESIESKSKEINPFGFNGPNRYTNLKKNEIITIRQTFSDCYFNIYFFNI